MVGADMEGYTCVLVDGRWLVVNRHGTPLDGEPTYDDYSMARARAEDLNAAVLAAVLAKRP